METADGSYRMRSLCRLQKGDSPALEPLRPAAAVATLIECAPFVNRNPYRYDRLVERLEELGAAVPCRC